MVYVLGNKAGRLAFMGQSSALSCLSSPCKATRAVTNQNDLWGVCLSSELIRILSAF